VVVTDVAQFTLLFMGAVVTIILITVKMGSPLEWFPTSWDPNWDRFVIFSFDPLVRMSVLGTMIHYTVWWICTAGSDQMAIQRFVATKDVKAARRTFLCTMISEKTLFFILICVGFSLLSFYRANPYCIPDGKDLVTDADFLFPAFIANYLPIGISGLVIAAIFSAAMSSLSSGINSTAAVITTDIIPLFTGKSGSDSKNLRFARWCSLIVGILVVCISSTMAYVPGNITEVTAKTGGLFVSPLFNLFCMALFVRFATPFGTIMGSIYSFTAAFIVAFWDVLTGQPGITFLWIGPGSLLVGICCSLLFSLISTRGKGIKTYIFWSVILLLPIVVLFALLLNL